MNTALQLLGYKTETFSEMENMKEQANKSPGLFASGIIIFLVFLALGVIYCYGAAKLSYDYNMSINNLSSAMMWSVICYCFPAIYYPYYALFLNPVNPAVSQHVMTGARRRRV
jgi:hypothetical protein